MSLTPYKRPIIAGRELARQRQNDPNHIVGTGIEITGTGEIADEGPFSSDVKEDTGTPSAGGHAYGHFPRPGADADAQWVVSKPINPAAGKRLPQDNWPAQTLAGQSVTLRWQGIRQARHLLVQNNSGAVCYIDFDAPANVGSLQVVADGTFSIDAEMFSVSVYTVAAQNLNQNAAGIYIAGWQ